MFSLDNKTAFVTGAASGIGLAVAEAFIEQGASVVIADLADCSARAESIGAHPVHVNVADESSVAEALNRAEESLGKLDIVVNNAGIGDVGPDITDTDQTVLEKVTAVNHFGVLYGLKHAPNHMNDHGAIINTSSLASTVNVPGSAVYSAGKAAVNSLTQMAALELGHRGIRVNAICPAYVATALGSGEDGRILNETFTALKRSATTADVVGAYVFLASDASRFITGELLRVDGGWHCGPTPQLLEKVIGSSQGPG